MLRIAQRRQQRLDHLKAQTAFRQAERAQPRQLRGHAGMIGGGEIAHLVRLSG
jgi:hypothetical protein